MLASTLIPDLVLVTRLPGRSFGEGWSLPILFVADLFHPVNRLAVQRLLNSDMNHRGRWRRAMPMLLVGFKPNDIAGSDFFNLPAPTLNPPKAGRDDQRLTEWMRMPGGAGARFERDA